MQRTVRFARYETSKETLVLVAGVADWITLFYLHRTAYISKGKFCMKTSWHGEAQQSAPHSCMQDHSLRMLQDINNNTASVVVAGVDDWMMLCFIEQKGKRKRAELAIA